MSKRLTRIYTRTGDHGDTGLADGTRVRKDSPRIEALGSLDELNSLLGVIATAQPGDDTEELLLDIQHRLFDLGGELAIPGARTLTAEQVVVLEHRLDAMNALLPPLDEFVLPGGNPLAAHCHHARSVCRRAERDLWRLARVESTNPVSLQFLNRLADLLFVLARRLARRDGGHEITWQRGR